MKYQNMMNLLDNTPSQLSKFRTQYWLEINDDSHGTYSTGSQVRFESSMLRSCICDYSDVYILVSRTMKTTRGLENATPEQVIIIQKMLK